MHVHTQVVRRRGKEYRYTQLCQAYRNERGVPTRRVLLSVPELPPVEVANLKKAVEASRNGQVVLLPREIAGTLKPSRVRANHDYLDIAVALSMWHRWRLAELIDRLVVRPEVEVPVSEVVAALVLHRCVDPDSKLAAVRWYPRTALPELQGVKPRQFNNSRLHRVLADLEAAEEELQQRLSERIVADHPEALYALFLDVTDTWFVGRGPDMASKGRTKEGLFKRRIGVVLLCDPRGYPLHWKTLPGWYQEAEEMQALIRRVARLGWVGDVPIVADRAMGRAGQVELLLDSGVRFITAVPVDEFTSYTQRIPYQAFEDLQLGGTAATRKRDLKRLQQAAEHAGLKRVSSTRYVLDLEEITRHVADRSRKQGVAGEGPVAAALRSAQMMRGLLDDGEVRDHSALAERFDCSVRSIRRYLELLSLTPRLQERVLDGQAELLTMGILHQVARLPEARQAETFARVCAERKTARRGGLRPRLTGLPEQQEEELLRVRGVVSFNPERFLDAKRNAREVVRRLDAFIADLNHRLRSPYCRLAESGVLAEVYAELKRYGVMKLYKVEAYRISIGTATPRWQVRLQRNEQARRTRQRFDGFNLIIAHPDLVRGDAELVETYFAKDVVEKDFQTIKSELDLRPFRHRTDHKARAHVTLCVLALLLERTLEHQLKSAGLPTSAPRCFEVLAPCHLNEFPDDCGPAYNLTDLTGDQRALLTALDLCHLADEEELAAKIAPR